LILASVLALIFGGLSEFCPLQMGSANCLLLALGSQCRHSMDSVVLRRLQPINQCYGNPTWEITQMFVEGQLQVARHAVADLSGTERQAPLPCHTARKDIADRRRLEPVPLPQSGGDIGGQIDVAACLANRLGLITSAIRAGII